MDAFRTALEARVYREVVEADLSDGRIIGVSATPTLFINGSQYTEQYSVSALQAAADRASAQN